MPDGQRLALTSPQWRTLPWFAVVAVTFVAVVLVELVIRRAFPTSSQGTYGLHISIALVLRETVALVALLAAAHAWLRVSMRAFGVVPLQVRQIVLGTFCACVLIGAEYVTAPYLRFLGHDRQWLSTALHGASPAAQFLLLFVVGFYSPWVQELVFRGLLFKGLAQRMPLVPAIFIASLIFGFAHIQTGMHAAVLTSVFGAMCCILTWRTQNITAAVSAHVTTNTAIMIEYIMYAHRAVH